MANEQNLIPWQKGQSGNPSGMKKGTRHRSTIIRAIAECKAQLPETARAKLKELFPDIPNELTVAQVAVYMSWAKVMTGGDPRELKIMHDEMYGVQKSEVEVSGSLYQGADPKQVRDFFVGDGEVEEAQIIEPKLKAKPAKKKAARKPASKKK